MRNKVIILAFCVLSVFQNVQGSEIVQLPNPFELHIDYSSYKKNLDINSAPEWVREQFGSWICCHAGDARKEFTKDVKLLEDQISRIKLGVVKKLKLTVPSEITNDYNFLNHLSLFFNTPSISDLTFNGHTHISRNTILTISSGLQTNNTLVTLDMSELCSCLDDQSRLDLLEGLNINKSIRFFNGEEKTIGVTKLDSMDCKGAICSYPQSFHSSDQTTNAEELDYKIVLDYNMLLKSPDHFPVPNWLSSKVHPDEVQKYITKARDDVHFSVESFQICRELIFSGSKRKIILRADSNIMKMDFFLRDLNDLLCRNIIEELSFEDTPTLSIEAIGIISNALKSTQSLKVLNLSGAFLESHPNDIKMMMHSLKQNHSITKLDMSKQKIEAKKCAIFLSITDMLGINQTIETLDLSHTEPSIEWFQESHIMQLGFSLSKNKTLKHLNLNGHFLNSSKFDEFLQRLRDSGITIQLDYNKGKYDSIKYLSLIRLNEDNSDIFIVKASGY